MASGVVSTPDELNKKKISLPYLRDLLAGNDLASFKEILRGNGLSREQLRSFLAEIPAGKTAWRLLAMHPELAGNLRPAAEAPAVREPESRAAVAGVGLDLDRLIARQQFQVGAVYPPLRQSVIQMPRIPDASIRGIGSDGLGLFYQKNLGEVPAEYVFHHTLIHCLFRHMIQPGQVLRSMWDLACDMSAEYLRGELFSDENSHEQMMIIKDSLPSGCDPRIPIQVYRGLMELFEDEIEVLTRRFTLDDHRYWYQAPPAEVRGMYAEGNLFPGDGSGSGSIGKGRRGSSEENEGGMSPEDWQEFLQQRLPGQWIRIAEAMQQHVGKKPIHGLTPGSREEKMLLRQAGKYDFSRYLRRFSTVREEIQLDPDSFDYIPYCYGLERYGNLPLIEPLEYTETSKVEELVIAIDTSGSCSHQVVERFLGEIQHILMDRANFFKKMSVHIIQCDAMIQDHQVIHSLEEWKQYIKDLKIKGRGGTNFRPVFKRVAELREKGELSRLRGLLYFTDGDGVYPKDKDKTAYETAFVFTERRALYHNIPDWIIRLCLEPLDPYTI